MSRTADHATTLAELHDSDETLVLPTVWDTWSAEVAAQAGFRGLTVGRTRISPESCRSARVVAWSAVRDMGPPGLVVVPVPPPYARVRARGRG